MVKIPAVSSSHSPGTHQGCPSLPRSAAPAAPHTECSTGTAPSCIAFSAGPALYPHCMLSWFIPTTHCMLIWSSPTSTLRAQLVQPYIHTACSAGSSPSYTACLASPVSHPPCILSWSSPTSTLYALLTAVPDCLHALVLLA